MRVFTLAVLNIYRKYPKARASEIAKRLGVPPQMIKESRKILQRHSFLLRSTRDWYITFAGRLALTKFDKDKAAQSHNIIKEAVEIICRTLDTTPEELEDFSLMDKGMTNDSYIFYCKGKKYIYRLAGQGTEVLVDRHREYANYLALDGKNISDKVIYHNALTGTKISEFIEGSVNVDEKNPQHVEQALAAIRNLHTCGIFTDHTFDFYERINYYEDICRSSEVEFFTSYKKYKALLFSLLDKIKTLNVDRCFCHIDFIPDNCMYKDDSVILIDWEYSGMQDPLVDMAMFCIAVDYDKRKSDKFIKDYLTRTPTNEELFRFYSYLAAGGLTWSLWSEYKAAQGEIFEGYTQRVYKICKKYTEHALKLMNTI